MLHVRKGDEGKALHMWGKVYVGLFTRVIKEGLCDYIPPSFSYFLISIPNSLSQSINSFLL